MRAVSPRLVWRLARRNVWRNPKRSLLTLGAIAVGIWSALCLGAFTRGINQQLVSKAINNLTGHIKATHPAYLRDPALQHSISAIAPAARRVLDSDRVEHWASRVRVPGVVLSERESAGVMLLGIDYAAERGLSFIGEGVSRGRALKGPADDGVILGVRLAELLQTEVGKRVVLMSEGADGGIADRGFRVVGLFDAELDSTEKSFVFTGREVLQRLIGLDGAVSEISALVTEGAQNEVLRELRQAMPEYKVETWETLEPLTVAMRDIQGGFLHIWNFIVVIAIGFGLVNTLFMAIFERAREFGLFGALGMKPLLIYLQILGESAALLMLGILIGNAAGFATIGYFAGGLDLSGFAEGLEHFGAGKVVFPRLEIFDVVSANATVLILALLSSLYPAWRASRLEPVEALAKV